MLLKFPSTQSLFINNGNFINSSLIITDPAQTSRRRLSTRGDADHPCLIPDLKDKASSESPLSIIANCFFVELLIRLTTILSTPS